FGLTATPVLKTALRGLLEDGALAVATTSLLLPLVDPPEAAALSRRIAEAFPAQTISDLPDRYARRLLAAAPEAWLASLEEALSKHQLHAISAVAGLMRILAPSSRKKIGDLLTAATAGWETPWQALGQDSRTTVRLADLVRRALFDAGLF